MNPKIKILELRFIHAQKPLKAFVDVQFGDWIIREWRVIKDNGKRPWVAPPQLSWKAPDGRIQYKTIVTLPDELKGDLDQIILNAFSEEMEKQNAHQ